MCGRCCSLGCLPLVLALLSLSTFIITYSISVYDKDVNAWFPTISQTADHSPESNVFGQLFNICSFLGAITVFVRYLQLRHDADWNERDRPALLKLNRASLAFGLLFSFGSSLVANFQDNNVEVVHTIGALLSFTCGILYCWIQTLITFKMKNSGLNTESLFSTRLALAILMTLFFAACLSAQSLAGGSKLTGHDKQNRTQSARWSKDDKGYIPHIVSDVSEWLMALSMLWFIATFYGELKAVRMRIVVSRNPQRPVPLAISDDDTLTAPLLL